jgi:hypothetical protein
VRFNIVTSRDSRAAPIVTVQNNKSLPSRRQFVLPVRKQPGNITPLAGCEEIRNLLLQIQIECCGERLTANEQHAPPSPPPPSAATQRFGTRRAHAGIEWGTNSVAFSPLAKYTD